MIDFVKERGEKVKEGFGTVDKTSFLALSVYLQRARGEETGSRRTWGRCVRVRVDRLERERERDESILFVLIKENFLSLPFNFNLFFTLFSKRVGGTTLIFSSPLSQTRRGVSESGGKLKAQLRKKGGSGRKNDGAEGKNMDDRVLA